jgi:hypothetical protein
MIGKIEKAHRYAREPERISIKHLVTTFHGSHDDYEVRLDGDTWTCTCHTFEGHMVDTCSHIMAIQHLLGKMLPEDARFAHQEAASVA